MSLPLRPYQETGVAAIEQFVAGGGKRPLLAWATGLGKTVAFSHWIARRGERALVIAHRDELLQQAREKLQFVLPDDWTIGTVKAETHEPDAAVVLASIQTLARSPHRLADILAGGVGSVVIDEAHHSEAASYQAVLKAIRFGTSAVVLGVTATPARADHKPLGRTWEQVVHQMSILDGIAEGYLADLKGERLQLKVDLNKVAISHGDYVEAEAGKALIDAKAPTQIAQALAERPKRRTLIFTAGVELAHLTAEACRQKGLKIVAIDGDMDLDARRQILDAFHAGTIEGVVNCNLLTEGYDEPAVDQIVIARPTRSEPFYIQMIGRGTRLFPGKTHCLVLDCVGTTTANGLVTLPELLRLWQGHDAAAAVADGLTLREVLQQIADGKLVAQPVPLTPQFAWVQAGGAWVLGLGDGSWLQLIEQGLSWLVERVRPTGIESLIAAPSLEYAQGFAEDVMRKAGAEALNNRNAPWRRAPMSAGQRRALDKWGAPYSGKMTRGEASDLLMRLIAGKAARARRHAS